MLGSDGDTFLERVRVTVEATELVAFTDDTGFYRLDAVPAGPARVTLFYTGMAPHAAIVNINAGETTRHDVTLVAAGGKEAAGAAIAIDEQRFAPNNKNVVARALKQHVGPAHRRHDLVRRHFLPVPEHYHRHRGRRRHTRRSYRLATYALLSTTGSEQHNIDTQRTAFARARRAFDWRGPVVLRTGLEVRRSERDLQGFTSSFTYVGRDGRASTTLAGGDDAALPFLDAGAATRVAPFGFPHIE